MLIDQWTMSEAASSNTHTALVQYLLDIGAPLGIYAAQSATENPDLRMLKWILERHAIQEWFLLTYYAADLGRIDVLEWLVTEEGVSVSSFDLSKAAGGGQTAAMEWLIDHDCEVTLDVCHAAAYYGASEDDTCALEWLREHAHLHLSEDVYLFMDKLRQDDVHSSYAHVWEWLREVAECPWNASELAAEAIQDDCVEALQYVHEHGGPFDADQLANQLGAACRQKSFQAAEYLLAQGAAWPEVLIEVFDMYICPDMETLEWTYRHGTIAWARAHGFTGVVKYWNPPYGGDGGDDDADQDGDADADDDDDVAGHDYAAAADEFDDDDDNDADTAHDETG